MKKSHFALLLARLVAKAEIQAVVRVNGVDIHESSFGGNAVKLHTLGGILVVVRLRLGGKDKPVVIFGDIDRVALGKYLRPVADIVLPFGRVGKFDKIAVSLPDDSMKIIIVAALAVAVCR